MKKAFISFFTVVAVTCSLSVTSFADTVNNTSLNQDKVQYNQISSEIKDLDSNINTLTNEINSLNSTINNNKVKVQSIENNISNANIQIADTQKQIEKGQEVLGDRLSAIYKSGAYSPASYLVYILQANGFSQLISRMYDVQRIVSIDDQLINNLKSNKSKIQQEVDTLNAQKQEILNLNTQTQKNLTEVVQKEQTVQSEKAKLNTQLQSVASVISANENQLVSFPIGVINNASSSVAQLQDAVQTLKDLLPQITMQPIIDKMNSAISTGNNAINSKIAAEKAAKAAAEKAAAEKAADKNNNSNSNSNNSSNNNSSINNNSNSGGNGSWNGQYKQQLSMEATAYSGGGLTAMGTAVVRNPGGISTVAVDPSVIPLGSKLYIPGYGFAIAADTGGAIKGHRIDLYMNSNAECNAFGRRQMTVYVVAYPGQW